MEQMMSGIEKSKTDFVAFRGSKMISSTPSNPGLLSDHFTASKLLDNDLLTDGILVTYRFVDFNIGGTQNQGTFEIV